MLAQPVLDEFKKLLNADATTTPPSPSLTNPSACESQKEIEYVRRAKISIYMHMRSLSTVYVARELNFKENEILRSAYLDFVVDNFAFGTEIKDWIKTLPTVALGGISGVAIATAYGAPNYLIWGAAVFFAIIAFAIQGYLLQYKCKRKEWTYMGVSFERTLYYCQYLDRVTAILKNLYSDLNQLHKEVFGEYYPITTETALNMEAEIDTFIKNLFKGVKPSQCPMVYPEIYKLKKTGIIDSFMAKVAPKSCITPEIWAVCETNNQNLKAGSDL